MIADGGRWPPDNIEHLVPKPKLRNEVLTHLRSLRFRNAQNYLVTMSLRLRSARTLTLL